MTEEAEERLLKPIINACYPGTLSALSLAVLEITGRDVNISLRVILSMNALFFSLQRVLHLLLHHLSLEEVALDRHSHNFHVGTMRFTHCGDLVGANLIRK